MTQTFDAALQAYRTQIDVIDRQLLNLFDERSQIVASVGKLKEAHGVSGSFARPGREAIMMRHILDNVSDTSLPRASIAAIWRIIIGSSTALESPMNVVTFDHDAQGVHEAAYYFGTYVPHRSLCESTFFEALKQDKHAIAVVPYHTEAHWWRYMPDPMRVFACLPFVGSNPTHLALGHVVPEETGDDVSLFYDYVNKNIFGREGFHTDEKPLAVTGDHALYIGSYASPYPLT